jgi:MFS family permease
MNDRLAKIVLVVAALTVSSFVTTTAGTYLLIMQHAFFPPGNDLARSHTLFTGSLARTLLLAAAAAILGAVSDRGRRKMAITISLVLIGTGSLGLCLTPPISMVGLLSSALFFCFSTMLWAGAGALPGSALAYVFETAQPENRAAILAVALALFYFVGMMANIIDNSLFSLLGQTFMIDKGWRGPLALGGALLPAAYFAHRLLDPTAPLPPVALGPYRPLAIRSLGIFSAFAMLNIISGYTVYSANSPRPFQLLPFLAAASFAGSVVCVVCGWAWDRGYRSTILTVCAMLFLLAALLSFVLTLVFGLASPSALVILVSTMIVCTTLASVARFFVYIAIAEQFPAALLARGIGIPLALGSFVPLLLTGEGGHMLKNGEVVLHYIIVIAGAIALFNLPLPARERSEPSI